MGIRQAPPHGHPEIEPFESHHDSGSSQQLVILVGIEKDMAERTGDRGQKINQQHPSRSQQFHRQGGKDPQEEKVEDEVGGPTMQEGVADQSQKGEAVIDCGISTPHRLPAGGHLQRDGHETIICAFRAEHLEALNEAHHQDQEKQHPLLADYPVLVPLHPQKL